MEHAAQIFAFGKMCTTVWQSGDLAAWAEQEKRLFESQLQDLRKKEYIVGRRGPRGGYELTQKGKEVTLATLVELYGNETDKALLTLCRERYEAISPMEIVDAVKDREFSAQYLKESNRLNTVVAA
jgi:DNA-binding PadR family transcriptional regulator